MTLELDGHTVTFGESSEERAIDCPLDACVLELSRTGDELTVTVVEGAAPEAPGALRAHRPELALDAFLPPAEAEVGLTWRLDTASIRRGLGLDVAGALFPDPPREESPEGSDRRSRRRLQIEQLLLLLVRALIVVLVVFLRPVESPDVTYRGAMDLEVVRIRLGEATPQDGLVNAKTGDRLQYTVSVPSEGTLQVFDVQDDGEVSLWKAESVQALKPVTGAAILDDYEGAERIFFVVTDKPLRKGEFEEAVHDVWRAPVAELDKVPGLGRHTIQRSILVIRESP